MSASTCQMWDCDWQRKSGHLFCDHHCTLYQGLVFPCTAKLSEEMHRDFIEKMKESDRIVLFIESTSRNTIGESRDAAQYAWSIWKGLTLPNPDNGWRAMHEREWERIRKSQAGLTMRADRKPSAPACVCGALVAGEPNHSRWCDLAE